MYVTIRKRTEKSQQALGGRFQVREVTAGSGGTGAWHHMQGHGRKTTATAVAVTAEGMWCHPALGTTCGFTAGRRPSRQQRSRQQGSRQRGLITPASALSAVGVTAAGLDNTSLGVISRQGHGSVCHGRCPFKKNRFLCSGPTRDRQGTKKVTIFF